METIDTSRRGFLKSAAVASAAVMASAAANAGIAQQYLFHYMRNLPENE